MSESVASNLVTLLPCPFCAGEVEVAFYHPDMGPSSCYVKCWCGARGTEHQYHHGDSKEAIVKARASWNRRSSPETSAESISDVLAIRLRNAKEFMTGLPNGPALHHLSNLVAAIEQRETSRPFLQCRFCKRTTTREDRGDTYGSYCGVKLDDGGPCPGVMALYPADGSAVKTSDQSSGRVSKQEPLT